MQHPVLAFLGRALPRWFLRINILRLRIVFFRTILVYHRRNVYIRLLGPSPTVLANKDAYDALIRSARSAD